MTLYLRCWNRDKVGKGIGQARALAVCKNIQCSHLTTSDTCGFKSEEQKRVLLAGKKALSKKSEREEQEKDYRTGASQGGDSDEENQ